MRFTGYYALDGIDNGRHFAAMKQLGALVNDVSARRPPRRG
jgi:hypothetical protein